MYADRKKTPIRLHPNITPNIPLGIRSSSSKVEETLQGIESRVRALKSELLYPPGERLIPNEYARCTYGTRKYAQRRRLEPKRTGHFQESSSFTRGDFEDLKVWEKGRYISEDRHKESGLRRFKELRESPVK